MLPRPQYHEDGQCFDTTRIFSQSETEPSWTLDKFLRNRLSAVLTGRSIMPMAPDEPLADDLVLGIWWRSHCSVPPLGVLIEQVGQNSSRADHTASRWAGLTGSSASVPGHFTGFAAAHRRDPQRPRAPSRLLRGRAPTLRAHQRALDPPNLSPSESTARLDYANI
jgi:hypothetical protein